MNHFANTLFNILKHTFGRLTTSLAISGLLLLAGQLHAQVTAVQLALYQGCGSATVVAQVSFVNGNVTAASVTLERQGSANTWSPVVTRPYSALAAQFEIGPSEISAPTFFRVTVLDQVTGDSYISNNVNVNPALWNAGLPSLQASSSVAFGNTCGTNTLTIFCNGGRGPYTFEYKKESSSVWIGVLPQTAYNAEIPGIEANVFYNGRVTDRCGSVFNIRNMLIMTTSQFGISPTNCNNGTINILSTGVSPITHSFIKYAGAGTTVNPTVYSLQSTYTNLAPGVYYISSKDACGNVTNNSFSTTRIVLGAGFPTIDPGSVLSYQTDSCYRNLLTYPATGFGPFEYSIAAPDLNPSGPRMYGPWQSSRVFDSINTAGLLLVRAKDACGSISDSARVNVPNEAPEIFSHQLLPNPQACIKEIVPTAGRGYQPYEFGYGLNGSPTFAWQTSDTIQAPPGIYQLLVRDRCKRVSYFSYNYTVDVPDVCPLRTQLGDYLSSSTNSCTTLGRNEWIDMRDDLGNLVYSINPANNTLPDVCWGVRVADNGWVAGRPGLVNGKKLFFLDRNVFIQPAFGTTINDSVGIRIYFTYEEFSRLQSVVQMTGPQIDLDDLVILKIKGQAGAPSDLEVSNNNVVPGGLLTLIRPTVGMFGENYYIEFKVKDFSEFNPYYSTELVLPLDFLSFTANKTATGTALRWSTENEVNTSNFDVQWSTDGITFRSIGNLPSASSPGVHVYSFIHANPVNGTNYYRIRQVDLDGKAAYSKVIILGGADVTTLQLSPNPAHDELVIRTGSNNARNLVRVTDASGRVVINKIITGFPAELDIHGLPKGWYMLELQGRGTDRVAFIKD